MNEGRRGDERKRRKAKDEGGRAGRQLISL
jgi:hypothetical protein